MKNLNIVTSIFLEDKKEKIATIIKTKRVQKGWTQKELGIRIKMSQNTIARIENKKFFPSMESLLLILDCLDLTLKINNNLI